MLLPTFHPLFALNGKKNTYDDFATVRVCINGDLRMRSVEVM
jgi:hypothetical protein